MVCYNGVHIRMSCAHLPFIHRYGDATSQVSDRIWPAQAAGRGRRTDDRSRPDGGRERGATRPHLRAQRGERAHQRQPRPRNRAHRSGGERPGAHRRAASAPSPPSTRRGRPGTSSPRGFTEEEHRRLAEWADGPRLFEHFRDLEGPLRIADVPAYVRALGFPTDRLPSKTFQGTPMRHRGVHVGNFYLVEKAGGEAFTDEDEQILVLFAAQAATAIANARTYRAERRARADLEALIETSPVGVVVFNAGTGHLVSLNREATRLVQSLCGPGQSAGAPARGHHLPARRRARDRARSAPARRGAERRRDGARRGDRALGPRRAPRHHAHQRHPDPRRGRRRRVGGGHHAGSGPAAGPGTDAGGVPRHGQPRTARAADLHQGLDRGGPRRRAARRAGRDARVLPNH